MGSSFAFALSNIKIRTALIDLGAIAFIYLVSTLSHLLALPVYLIEPMRIMLILSIAHTRKENAYLLALTLPMFSFVVSAHPVLLKMILISFELSLNVWLFFLLKKHFRNNFLPAILSIIGSKAVYYIAKYLMISFALLNTAWIATPLLLQIFMTFVLGLYLYKFYKQD